MKVRLPFDLASLAVILITLVLFVFALFEKGFTHDLLLEAGVLMVSVKLIIMGGRDFFAGRWFKDFQIGLIQTRLQHDPQVFMKEVHDRQPMEADANARMRQVEKALPNGLVAPGSAGRR